MYKKTVLNNGIRIIAHPMANRKSVALGIWIKAGGRYESPEIKGISHYLEHLLFKGSKKYSCHAIKESIEGVGGSLNGFTSEELTCYLVKLPSYHRGLALDILSDMVLHPLLAPSDIERERTVILEEIKMYKDLPQSYVYELLDELLWPKQPLGGSVLGTNESVSAITKDTLTAYKQRYYNPCGMVISAAGSLDYPELVSRIKSIFCSLKQSQAGEFPKALEMQDEPRVKVLAKDTEQTHLALGFHSFKREHRLKHAVALLHIVLGANMSSRLFNELREKRGMAYEIGTSLKRFQDTGAFIVHAGIDNRKLKEALALIIKELAKAKCTLINPDEFKRAKEFYLGQLMLALEDTLDNMLWIGESTASLDTTHTLEEIVAQVQRLTRKDVLEAANHIFEEKKLNLALIGPLKGEQGRVLNHLRLP